MDKFDALCEILVTKHGIAIPAEIWEPKKDEPEDGSSSGKYGPSDWTAAGYDKDGFPVEKGSPEDVSPADYVAEKPAE